MKNQAEKIERINEYLNHSEKITDLFYSLLELQNANFKDVTNFCGLDSNKIDSAYPNEYVKEIRNIYPNFDKGLNCFDYSEKSFGEMRNIKNDFFNTIFEVLKNY